MKPAKLRFDIQLSKVEVLFAQAKLQSNPAQWLYLNNLRTPMFMLEALAKLYSQLHNKKKFEKLQAKFKIIEDALGAIDHYTAFEKEFVANNKIPIAVNQYLVIKIKDSENSLNKILKKQGWLTGKRLIKINKQLAQMNWLNETKETNLITRFYTKEIKKIIVFMTESNFIFDDLEANLHEFRRNLRWLSIYPQALQGAVVLQENKKYATTLKSYLTTQTLDSPYNKLPVSDIQTKFVALETNNFMALSWLINALGKLKDLGLKIEVVKEALQHNSTLTKVEAEKNALLLLGKNYPTIEQVLGDASKISKPFFAKKILLNLLYK
ncbi:MAG: hypothetical protein H7331_11175 [Bacteroidia bacterium]|nr:hypothetical protein [Bacteroidia bacterium]